MDGTKECWEVLPKVSRSFALCIKVLPKPLDEQMMISYLIYRVIDTIEDSAAPLEEKKELFDVFMRLLAERKMNGVAVEECRIRLCQLDCGYEKELLEKLPSVVEVYNAQPKEVRASILRWGKVMAKGMYEFQKRKIETLEDQDRYSYYVAGVVGRLITELLYYNRIIDVKIKKRLQKSERKFGLALQKVNILRDIAHDIKHKRYFWPSRLIAKYKLSYKTLCEKENRKKAMKVLRVLVDDAKEYLSSAMKYILFIPRKELRVRMFCLIPLFMAIESYVKCIDNYDVFDSEKKVKISREQVYDIVAKSNLWGSSDEKLMEWFSNSMKNAYAWQTPKLRG